MASTAELEAEILADLEENPDAYTAPVNDVITIDPETKTINLPSSEVLFGTEEEHGVERKYFKCPRIVGDNIDLFTHQIYISYMAVRDKNATFIPDSIPHPYWCDDVALDETGNYITFSWLLSGNVLASRGFVGFAVIAKSVEGDILKTGWKTAPAVGTVLMTVPDAGEGIAELYPDIITQLLDRMDAVEEIATVEAMQGYVDGYLAENPPSGMTAEEKAQLNKNTEDISSLSDEIANKTGTGLSTEAIDKLEEVGNYLAYTTADGGAKWTELISILRNGSSGGGSGEGSGETEKTLSSISATYTGGEVTTGTALSDLTGITVTATYSDGTTKIVTGYTLSGEILEGENTITVSYGGKTTTFTVTGIVESGGGEVTAELPTDGLVAYFDFRNTTPEINTKQGFTKFNANQGNGCLFTWSASAFTSSDDYGVKRMARSFTFDKDGGTNPSELGTSFTMLFKGYNVCNGAFVSNDHTGVSNVSVFFSKPKYNTSSGQLQVGQENIGNTQWSGYIDVYFVVDSSLLKLYINGELAKTYNGTDYEDFVSWYSKVTATVFGNGNYQTALALYGKALSEVEIAEARAFLQTLEVA